MTNRNFGLGTLAFSVFFSVLPPLQPSCIAVIMTPPVGVVADSITFFGVVQSLKEILPHHLLVDVQPQEEGVGEQEHHPHPEEV